MSYSAPLDHVLDNLFATLPPQIHPFLQLSYPINKTNTSRYAQIYRISIPNQTYDKGPLDLCIPISCAVAFTVLRNLSMEYIFSNFARYWLLPPHTLSKLGNGHTNCSARADDRDSRGLTKLERKRLEHSVTRFAEQSWSLVYCTVFWTLGVIILYRLKSPLSPESLWGSYPVEHLPGLTKFYYLAQLGWWLHQIYVINTEKRRSDHWQMLTHHVLSIALICGSYVANFSRVGTLIHALMDFCDILLPLAKLFRYLSLSTLCDLTFVIFLLGWLVSRQIGLAFVIYTSYHHAPRFIAFRWSPAAGEYLTKTTYWGFISAQVFLYCLASVWFYMACMVAVRVVTGQGAEDSRSDEGFDEDSESGQSSPSNGHALKINGKMDDRLEVEIDEIPDTHALTTATNGCANGELKHRR